MKYTTDFHSVNTTDFHSDWMHC